MSIVRPSGNREPRAMRMVPEVIVGGYDPRFRVVLSANIAAGGEATTTYGMTAPAGKSGSEFTTGRRWDDENGTDALTIAADFWTKVAWSIAPVVATVVNAEVYEFRLLADGVPLTTYSVTPQWTIGTPAGPGAEPAGAIMAQLVAQGWPRWR